MEKQVSIKISKKLKSKVIKKQLQQGYRFYRQYLVHVIMNYITSGKYKKLNVHRSEIGLQDANPTSIILTEDQYRRIKEVMNETNRYLNELANMIFVDLTRDV